MALYLSIIAVAITIICLVDIFALGYSPMIILFVLLYVVLAIAISGLCAFITERLPDKLFLPDKKIMDIKKGEQRFLEKLGIKKWKDKVWELGVLGGFRKNKIVDPGSPEYLLKFITESGKGMLGHIISIIAGGGLVFVYPKYALCIGLPVALVCALLNGLSTMVLRYNIPKLKIAHKRAERLKERAEAPQNGTKITNN